MAKMTLLAMTQNILNAMDGDAVNSISDTVESLQVAEIVVETYYELFSGLGQPSRKGLVQLEALSDPDRPHVMKIPDNVKNVEWIKYSGLTVDYMDPEEFLVFALDTDGPDYPVTYPSNGFLIYTDRDPTSWTTYDNNHIIFNGFNSDVDGSLQTSKTICWGQIDPVFEFQDAAYPPFLDSDAYPGLLAEAKSTCFVNLKQVSSAKEEQKSKRQRVRRQNDEWRLDQRRPYDRGPNYGRRSGAGKRTYRNS